MTYTPRSAAFQTVLSLCVNSRAASLPVAQPAPDWHAVFEEAVRHDVAPLVAHRLLAGRGGALPASMLEGLEIFAEGERLRGEQLVFQLQACLSRMHEAGIPAIAFKGPTLALDLYGDAGLRTCRDLDILVPADHVDRTLEVLQQLGYSFDAAVDARELAMLRAYAGQYILFHDQHVPVEPHWWVAPRTLAFDLDYASLWRASRHGDFQGVCCRLMSAEWSLLVLCLHGTKEKWHKLKWIIDIAMFGPAHPQLDWAALQQLASQQGCLRMLDMALLLVHRLLGTALPEPFRLRVTGDAPLSQRVDDAMAQLRGEREPEPGPYHLCRAYWQARERRRDRWRYALRTVFTPRVSHYRLLPLPRVLSPLYIPIKLVWDHLLGPLRRQWRARRARRLAC